MKSGKKSGSKCEEFQKSRFKDFYFFLKGSGKPQKGYNRRVTVSYFVKISLWFLYVKQVEKYILLGKKEVEGIMHITIFTSRFCKYMSRARRHIRNIYKFELLELVIIKSKHGSR